MPGIAWGTPPVRCQLSRRMKAHTISLTMAATIAVFGAGCASSSAPQPGVYSQYPAGTTTTNPNQTARGAVAGAAAGAVLGGIIGNNSEHGNTEKGAAIGAVAGGLAGAAVGHRADQRETSTVYSPDSGYAVRSIPPAPVSEPQENPPPQPAPNAQWIRGYYMYS